jgi:hypothetical protein
MNVFRVAQQPILSYQLMELDVSAPAQQITLSAEAITSALRPAQEFIFKKITLRFATALVLIQREIQLTTKRLLRTNVY